MPNKLFTAAALAAALVATLGGTTARAQTRVKLGVLNDRSGVGADITGEGSVVAARMAVEDFKAAEKGIKVELSRQTTRTSRMLEPTSPGLGSTQDAVDAISTCDFVGRARSEPDGAGQEQGS
jgi:branched-chain amino acid transport system substrate-binding protein